MEQTPAALRSQRFLLHTPASTITVIPAEAGIHDTSKSGVETCVDGRLRGHDGIAV
jgi:hypothetical protein